MKRLPVGTQVDELTFSIGRLGVDDEDQVQEDRAQEVLIEPAVYNVPAVPAVGTEGAAALENAENQQPPVKPCLLR